VEELGIPEITSEQTEELCAFAEEAARNCVLSKVGAKKVEKLNVIAEVEGTKPVSIMVDVDIALLPEIENIDVQKLADEAVKAGFAAAEKYLRELRCHSLK
jgi:hypothetical protein